MLRDVSAGGYRYIPGIRAFSSGVVATSGWEIVHATLAAPVPWRDGFARIDRHLREAGRPRAALCGIELRSPAPFSFSGFDADGDVSMSGLTPIAVSWNLPLASW